MVNCPYCDKSISRLRLFYTKKCKNCGHEVEEELTPVGRMLNKFCWYGFSFFVLLDILYTSDSYQDSRYLLIATFIPILAIFNFRFHSTLIKPSQPLTPKKPSIDLNQFSIRQLYNDIRKNWEYWKEFIFLVSMFLFLSIIIFLF